MHSLDSAPVNEPNKILWDVELQTDLPIQPRKPDLNANNKFKIQKEIKENMPSSDVCYSVGRLSKNKRKRND